jgi:hypothetical protein
VSYVDDWRTEPNFVSFTLYHLVKNPELIEKAVSNRLDEGIEVSPLPSYVSDMSNILFSRILTMSSRRGTRGTGENNDSHASRGLTIVGYNGGHE